MCFKRITRLTEALFKMQSSRMREFPADAFLLLIGETSFLILNLLFWTAISEAGFFVEGWSRGEMLAFVAFSELFFSLDSSMFGNASRFWRIIYSGELEVQLLRPHDPRLHFFLKGIDYFGIITAFIFFGLLLTASGESIAISTLIIGTLVVITAGCVLALIRLTLSYSAFILGKMDAICEVADSLTWFNKYPLVIMPGALRIIFKTVLPFYFFSTFSAEAVLGKIDFKTVAEGLVQLLLCAAIWAFINEFAWKRGLRRYESASS